MSIANITAKCWILALFIRDDGERFLLGDGAYDFKDSQQHFSANEFVNDTVDVQGNDGILLAGQVRRASSQVFDGYIGDGTTPKSLVENYRRDFIGFFAKNHFYKVVYVLPDGSAVQRQRGFIVDAPEVKELWQQTPEYHVALNFEDTNYYVYDENAEGEEIYGELANIILSGANGGGAVWEEAVFGGVEFMGATEQTTYSGKNLFDASATPSTLSAVANVSYDSQTFTLSIPSDATTAQGNRYAGFYLTGLPSGTYNISYSEYSGSVASTSRRIMVRSYDGASPTELGTMTSAKSMSFTVPANSQRVELFFYTTQGTTSTFKEVQLESGSTATAFEPYVGGIPAPNPDYPQPINVVTGLQTVTVRGQSLELNLGKNLFDGQIEQGGFNGNGVNISATNRVRSKNFIAVKPKTQYTIKVNDFSTSIGTMCSVAVSYYSSADFTAYRIGYESWADVGDADGFAFTTPEGCNFVRFLLAIGATAGAANDLTPSDVSDIQLELGSTATSYASYFDPIELCKIGDFQDYIYKNGANWYLHKAVGKQVFGAGETIQENGSNVWQINGKIQGRENYGLALSDRFTNARAYPSAAGQFSLRSEGSNFAFYLNQSSASAVQTWFANNPTTVYYPYKDSSISDTQITDSTIISQLNAIEAAGRPTNVSAVSPNLPVIISVDVSGGLVWDEVGVVWEAGSGSGTNSIVVDGIASVAPIWTVSGPITNPTIEILSTNTSLTYEGSLAEGQTLIVDSNKMTATLNGMNVLGSISGDWLELSPGTNRVVFTATQAETTSSTLSWQKVVG